LQIRDAASRKWLLNEAQIDCQLDGEQKTINRSNTTWLTKIVDVSDVDLVNQMSGCASFVHACNQSRVLHNKKTLRAMLGLTSIFDSVKALAQINNKIT